MGETEIPKEIFEDYLKDINHKFTADKYNVIHHNCNQFTDDVAEFLTGQKIDEEYSRQAKKLMETPFGKMLEPMLTQMQGNIQNPQPGMFN